MWKWLHWGVVGAAIALSLCGLVLFGYCSIGNAPLKWRATQERTRAHNHESRHREYIIGKELGLTQVRTFLGNGQSRTMRRLILFVFPFARMNHVREPVAIGAAHCM